MLVFISCKKYFKFATHSVTSIILVCIDNFIPIEFRKLCSCYTYDKMLHFEATFGNKKICNIQRYENSVFHFTDKVSRIKIVLKICILTT